MVYFLQFLLLPFFFGREGTCLKLAMMMTITMVHKNILLNFGNQKEFPFLEFFFSQASPRDYCDLINRQ